MREPWRAFDAAWFARHQRVLLWLLAAPLLGRLCRWVLCIRACDAGYRRRIVQLLPHAYVVDAGYVRVPETRVQRGRVQRVVVTRAQYEADVRTHPKYAKRVYYALAPVWWALHAWDWAIADRWVPAWSAGFSTLTAYPDADPESTTIDGYVASSDPGAAGTTWGSLRGDATGRTPGTTDATAYAVRFDAGTTSNQWRELRRAILLFDTSALTSAAVISAATLSVYCSDKLDQNSATPDWDVVTSTPASHTALVAADFAQLGSTSQTGAAKSYASTTTSAYNTWTLSSTGRGNISKTGVSQFGLRNANYDSANVAPAYGGSEYFSGFQIRWADYSGTSSDPKLEVTYTIPPPDGLYLFATLDTGVVNLLPETVSTEALRWRRGMAGGGPTDRIADTGTCEFSLANGPTSSSPGRPLGSYTIGHASARPGWTFGTPIAVEYVRGGVSTPLWTGALRSVTAVPGQYRQRTAQCVAVDAMAALADTDVRSVSAQVNEDEVTILEAALAALPTSAQPASLEADAALDTYPYALDDASSGTKALSLLANTVISAQGYLWPSRSATVTPTAGAPYGSLVYENRQARPVAASAYTFDDALLSDVSAPGDTARLANRVRYRTHPRTVDAAATTVLYGLTSVEYVGPGETRTFVGDYRSPNNDLQLIGGTATVTPVAGTDYAGRANADGTGSNLNASLTVTATAYAASVQFVVANTGGTGAYLVDSTGTPLLQIRGKGIYDQAPLEFEASVATDYGERLLVVDLPYQDDGNIAQDFATFAASQWSDLSQQVDSVTIMTARASGTPGELLLDWALALDIGAAITVEEAMTLPTPVDAVIQAEEWTVTPPEWITVRYTLAPRVASTSLVLDDPTYGELDAPVAALGWA